MPPAPLYRLPNGNWIVLEDVCHLYVSRSQYITGLNIKLCGTYEFCAFDTEAAAQEYCDELAALINEQRAAAKSVTK